MSETKWRMNPLCLRSDERTRPKSECVRKLNILKYECKNVSIIALAFQAVAVGYNVWQTLFCQCWLTDLFFAEKKSVLYFVAGPKYIIFCDLCGSMLCGRRGN